MIELERTYLLSFLPEGLLDCPSKEIVDIYLPQDDEHPKLRIRKNGDKYEITKKTVVNEGDSSHQLEQTIYLNQLEFESLSQIKGKEVIKTRYYYPVDGRTAEIGVFGGMLKGLVMVDFEFETLEEKEKFIEPDFCLVEVTNSGFAAGGILCGKSYKDIEDNLKGLGYSPIEVG